jgi:hypothetical protein
LKIITAFAVGLALAAVLPAAPASALNARSFVSGHGNDANICTYAAPCRTFAGAYAKTNPGGEISVLDPAGYGPLTITTALSIVNDGVGEAGITFVGSGNAITINAGASDAVSLRGLTIEGGGVGTHGIVFNTGASLTVENCVLRHLTGDGILFLPNAASSLSVSNTSASDNAGFGIQIQPSGSGAVHAVFNRVQANNNSYGILTDGGGFTGTIHASVFDSVVAGNAVYGFYASSSGGFTDLTLFHSVAANNGTGLFANGANSIIIVAQSLVTGNTNGWQTFSGGFVTSFADNYIVANTANEAAPPSIARK